MSTAQFAVLGRGQIEPAPRDKAEPAQTRGMTLTAFMFLAVYGALRWSTMLAGQRGGRLFELLLLTLAIGWLGSHLSATRLWARVAAPIGIVAAALLMIPVSGFPLSWLLGLRIVVLSRAIGRGLSALPHVIVPYSGGSMAISGVIALGAALLLLAGALALCTPRRQVGQLRLVAAAVPLIVLAIVPSVLAEPRLASIHGAIMFLLLVGLLFSERVPARRLGGALVAALVAGVAAVVLAPAIETSRALFNVRTIGTAHVRFGERFDWNQTYTRLNWPRQGTDVLTVQARFPSYWKAEDIDLFNGSDWVSTDVGGAGSGTTGVSRASLARWTEPLTVTLGTMSTSQIIAAGVAAPPQASTFTLLPGNGPGTWTTERPVGPNTSYRVDAYAPEPSRDQLASAPARYPMGALTQELQLILPSTNRSEALFGVPASPIQFLPFGSAHHVAPYGGLNRRQESVLVRSSRYAPVFRLAMRLRAHADTPYAYVQNVLRYLSHGYTYDQSPPTGVYPLLTFLFHSHKGYCQQFAGAMALLLRMGGVPARVAAGFTTGSYDARTHSYSVSDLDAHTWVEAWFAGYGWVTFDPTPPSDPALHGHVALPAGQSSDAPTHGSLAIGQRNRKTGAAALKGPRHQRHRSHKSAGGAPVGPILLGLLAALLVGLCVLAWRRPHTTDALLDELERAFARSGRPLPPGTTLAVLERRFHDEPEAAAYVRTLRQVRYAGGGKLPTREERRAVRHYLGQNLGTVGHLRALIALPPLVRRLH